MAEDRWSVIEQIYHAALERTPEQRARFINEACASDASLRREVESLLAHCARGDVLLDRQKIQHVIDAMMPIRLERGASLGPYEVLAQVGKGGMGEVYKARDARLNRVVAIKVLPYELGLGPERRSRMEREAKAIASLNHPHICALFDIGEQNNVEYLVMEYLDGETLADRLKRGPLPLQEALRLAIQVLEALNHAHRRAIIHRDLKPSNVMLTASGIKLLDFGLAKMLDRTSRPASDVSVTEAGAIVGTLQYMAPEQLEGKPADERTDLYAFGSVLYEMLCGRRAFEGETQAALISAIMTKQPVPLHERNASLPPVLEHVVENCLAKDSGARWQAASDVMLELKWLNGAGMYAAPSAPDAGRHRRVLLLRAAIAVVLAAALSFLGGRFGATRVSNAKVSPISFEIPVPEDVANNGKLDSLAISPDGRRLVFAGVNKDGRNLLWVRDFDSLQPHLLMGAEGDSPFWAPDGRSIGFFSQTGKLQIINAAGGTPVTLCDAADANMGAFNGRGTTVFASGATGDLRSVPESGGQARVVLKADKSKGERALTCPFFLPDGRHFLYFSRNADPSKMGIYASTLDSSDRKFVLPATSCAMYASPGYILFLRDDALIAQPFDPVTLHLYGVPFTLAENFGSWDAQHRRFFSVSNTGVLVYRGNDVPQVQLTWYSREGKRLETVGENGRYLQIALSPDGTKVTLERIDTVSNGWDLWLLDLRTGMSSRLTADPANVKSDVVWSPDSQEIVFNSDRSGQFDLFRKRIGTTQDRLLYADNERKVPESWTGAGIVYTTGRGDMHLLKAEANFKPVPLPKTGFENDEPHVSPNGRWIAYGSTEAGPWDIYLASFPDFQNKRQISNGGGAQALWRGDGKELFYLTPDGKMMAVEIASGAILKTGVPKFLFETHLRPMAVLDQYGVTQDGQKFLVAEPVKPGTKPITVVLNWPSLIPSESSR